MRNTRTVCPAIVCAMVFATLSQASVILTDSTNNPKDLVTGRAAAMSDTIVCNGVVTNVPEGGEQPAFLIQVCFSGVVAPILVNLREADGSVSDQLWTEGSQARCCNFVSDDDPGSLNPNFAPTGFGGFVAIFSVAETGLPQDLSAFFNLPANFVTVQSDVGSVPEPATILLGAPAFLWFGFRAFRMRRRTNSERRR